MIPRIHVNAHVHITPAMRKSGRPGPDSAQVATFLAGLGRADPVVFEMAIDQIGNSWGPWGGGSRVGALSDASGASQAVRNSLGGNVADTRAMPMPAAVMGDPSPCVRRAAAQLLGRSDAPAAVTTLRAALGASDTRVRETAFMRVGYAQDAASFDAMVRALRDAEAEVGQQVAHALGEIGDPSTVAALAAASKDGNTDVRRQVIHALGQIQGGGSTDALVAAMKDADPEIRREAARALGQKD